MVDHCRSFCFSLKPLRVCMCFTFLRFPYNCRTTIERCSWTYVLLCLISLILNLCVVATIVNVPVDWNQAAAWIIVNNWAVNLHWRQRCFEPPATGDFQLINEVGHCKGDVEIAFAQNYGKSEVVSFFTWRQVTENPADAGCFWKKNCW